MHAHCHTPSFPHPKIHHINQSINPSPHHQAGRRPGARAGAAIAAGVGALRGPQRLGRPRHAVSAHGTQEWMGGGMGRGVDGGMYGSSSLCKRLIALCVCLNFQITTQFSNHNTQAAGLPVAPLHGGGVGAGHGPLWAPRHGGPGGCSVRCLLSRIHPPPPPFPSIQLTTHPPTPPN